MLINVTEEDIRLGKKHDDCACPIALAATRAFGIACVVSSYTLEPAGMDRKSMPFEARTFIRNFDDGWEVKPFSFEI